MSAASSSCPYLPLPLLLRTTAPKSFILSQLIFSLCTSLYPSIKWSDSTYPGFWSRWNGHAGHALSSTPLFYTPVVPTPRVSRNLVPGLAALTSPGNLLEITFQPHPRPMGSVNDRAFQGRVELCLDFPGSKFHHELHNLCGKSSIKTHGWLKFCRWERPREKVRTCRMELPQLLSLESLTCPPTASPMLPFEPMSWTKT